MLWVSPALTVYICVLTGILGACMGSFLNCMAWRIVHGESVLHGRSHCDVCGHVLGAGDLIPVLSYIMHKGRCKYCGAKLSAGHVFAEVLTALTFLLLVLKYDISLQALEYILLACLLLAAAFTDLEGYMIPDRFIVTGIVVRVVFLFSQGNMLENLMDALLGGFAVGGGLLLIVLLYEKVRQKEAMGGGDIKLLFLDRPVSRLAAEHSVPAHRVRARHRLRVCLPGKTNHRRRGRRRRRKAFSVGAVHLGGSDSHAPLRQRDHRRVFEPILT